MRITPRRLFGAAALLALCTTGLLGGTASASPDKPLDSGDTGRAVAVDGNLEWNHPNACVTAGLTGEAIDGDPEQADAVTLPNTVTEDKLLTITGGLEGFTVTGVVVKGSSAYNVYPAAKLGELNWTDLHAPLNSSGGPAGISHWFFCVEKATTPDNPGGENPGGENSSVVPTPSESVAVTPTTTPAPAAAAGPDDLANTGFDGGWLLLVGLGLVAAGTAFVASPKLRSLLRR